jgi:hypothetical protein
MSRNGQSLAVLISTINDTGALNFVFWYFCDFTNLLQPSITYCTARRSAARYSRQLREIKQAIVSNGRALHLQLPGRILLKITIAIVTLHITTKSRSKGETARLAECCPVIAASDAHSAATCAVAFCFDRNGFCLFRRSFVLASALLSSAQQLSQLSSAQFLQRQHLSRLSVSRGLCSPCTFISDDVC